MTALFAPGMVIGEGKEPEVEDGESRIERPPSDASAWTDESDSAGIDDPMAMYLRDIGGVALLTAEGEVALAKRIEEGRRAVLEGLCEWLPAMGTVSAWRDEIREGTLALRDVIDVETTYNGIKQNHHPQAVQAAGDMHEEGKDSNSESLTHSAMEASVVAEVMEILDGNTESYAKLRQLREKRIELARKKRSPTTSQSRQRRALEHELSRSMASIRLTDVRIEALVDEVREASEHLRRCEGALLGIAIECGVTRGAFQKQHEGRELESGWLSRVGRLRCAGWRCLAASALPLHAPGARARSVPRRLGRWARWHAPLAFSRG